jgi:Flp pilus assembly pilin Flp
VAAINGATEMFRKFCKDETAASAVEYATIAALLSFAALSIFSSLGTRLAEIFQSFISPH